MKIVLQSPIVVNPHKKVAKISTVDADDDKKNAALVQKKPLMKRIFQKKQHSSAKITKIEPLTSDIKLVTLKITNNKVSFQAGQFIGVYHPNKKAQEEDSIFPGTFSIASPPKDLPYVSFAIGLDHNPRNLRHYLYHNAKLGDTLYLDRQGSGTVAITPSMVMTPVGGPGGLVLVGGGSAVMGLVSIVEELLSHPRGRQIPFLKLLHSNRSNKDIPFYGRMKELEEKYQGQFSYQPFVTGEPEPNETLKGTPGRISVRDLANVVPGARLFCICGSGIFCEAMVNSFLELGVWPGSIRTDYTTRVDYARRLEDLENSATSMTESSYTSADGMDDSSLSSVLEEDLEYISDKFRTVSMTGEVTESPKRQSKRGSARMSKRQSQQSKRFASCTDGTQNKGEMVDAADDYLKMYGLDILMKGWQQKLRSEKPEYPLQFLEEALKEARASMPEISNAKAGDPNFWINYYETDLVTWQAPVVSPWLERYMKEFVGTSSKRVFVPLCGKSLDLKLLMDAGHHVIGAECSGIACSDFFIENNIPNYQKETVQKSPRVVRHYSSSLPIEIFEGDIFDLSPELLGGKVDCVLDRAALVALPPNCIEDRYLPLLLSLMTNKANMLFASVSELPFPKAPPHIYEETMIEGLLRKFFCVMEQKEVYRYRVNAGHVSEPIYLLKTKKSQL